MLGVVVLALSLRAPIIAPTPVIGEIRTDLAMTAAVAGLLTGLPVLLFSLTTPLVTRLLARVGPEAAVLVCLGGVLAGTVIRSAGSAPVVLLGTAVIGAAITVGNIVAPVIIRRDISPERATTATAAYTAALNVGSMFASLGTAPLAAAVGWRWALALWGVLTLVGLALWWVLSRARAARRAVDVASPAQPAAGASEPATPDKTSEASRRVRRIGWLLTATFCGQSLSYYSITAWLPALLGDTLGLSTVESGATASLFQVAAIVGAFGVPLLAARTPAWVPVLCVGVLWIALPVGLLLAPQWYVLWSIVGGTAQGGGFTAIFSIVARVTRSDAEAAGTSARIQGIGYLAAAAGPPVAGALNTLTGAWTAPLVLVLAATVVFTAAGLLAALSARGAAR